MIGAKLLLRSCLTQQPHDRILLFLLRDIQSGEFIAARFTMMRLQVDVRPGLNERLYDLLVACSRCGH